MERRIFVLCQIERVVMIPKEILKALYDIKENHPYLYKYCYEELYDNEYNMAKKESLIVMEKYKNISLYLGYGCLSIYHKEIIYDLNKYPPLNSIDFNNIDFSFDDYDDNEILYLKLMGF